MQMFFSVVLYFGLATFITLRAAEVPDGNWWTYGRRFLTVFVGFPALGLMLFFSGTLVTKIGSFMVLPWNALWNAFLNYGY